MAQGDVKMKLKGVARIKKFNDPTKNPEIDEPDEIVEREFDLNEDQVNDIRNGKRVVIEDDKPVIK